MKTGHLTKIAALFLASTVHCTVFGQEFVQVPAEEVNISSERLAYLTQTFEEYIDNGDLPGSVVLVARKGQIAYLRPFGKSNMEKNVAMKENTIFRIASQTKAIVSVGIMILQEEGKLLINEPLGKYIPAFSETKVAVPKEDGAYEIVEANRPITIRDF